MLVYILYITHTHKISFKIQNTYTPCVQQNIFFILALDFPATLSLKKFLKALSVEYSPQNNARLFFKLKDAFIIPLPQGSGS